MAMSRFEEILQAIINGEECDLTPQSRAEVLLLALLDTIQSGSGTGTDDEWKLLANVTLTHQDATTVTVDDLSRYKEFTIISKLSGYNSHAAHITLPNISFNETLVLVTALKQKFTHVKMGYKHSNI